ncbi:unnamed protein product [Parnassius apollo]|uniref:(apollo) hypothetical protein n=1 Tax=Parnassius apollo TaxID=110799 RepID=A0A8S3WRV3_PARAO|nr:unnamed protein product [Parnassius apollo]
MPFNSLEFHSFAKDWGFSIITSSLNYPRSNEFIEIMMGIAKDVLRKCKEQGIEKEYMLLDYRNIGSPYTPTQLIFSRETGSELPIHDKLLYPKVINNFAFHQKKKMKVIKVPMITKTATQSNHKFYKGQNIWYRKDKVWNPGMLVDICANPRSMIIDRNEGVQFRRNTAHVKPRIITVPEENDVSEIPEGDTGVKLGCTRPKRNQEQVSKEPSNQVFKIHFSKCLLLLYLVIHLHWEVALEVTSI